VPEHYLPDQKIQHPNDVILRRIEAGEVGPSFVVTRRSRIEDALKACATFRDKSDNCIQVVIKP
jgi:threonine dehydrogenase-like Zn-dependent dehydrogenase